MYLLIKKIVKFLIDGLLSARRDSGISYATRLHADRLNSAKNRYGIREMLGTNKLLALDVGARLTRDSINTIEEFFDPLIKNFEEFFTVVVCEVDPAEANLLRDSGLKVIDCGLGSASYRTTLNVSADKGCSSLFEANRQAIEFMDPKGWARFKTVDEGQVKIDTISSQLITLGVTKLDYLKIDTQGYELEVLKGLGMFRPFLIKAEVSLIPIYLGQPLCPEIDIYLHNLGYLKIHQHLNYHQEVLGLHGDAWYIPNIFVEEGLQIIKQDVKTFVAICKMIGLDYYGREGLAITSQHG